MNLYAEQYACSYLYNGEKREILLERGLTEEGNEIFYRYSKEFNNYTYYDILEENDKLIFLGFVTNYEGYQITIINKKEKNFRTASLNDPLIVFELRYCTGLLFCKINIKLS